MMNSEKYESKLDNALNLQDEVIFAFFANLLWTGLGQIYLKKYKKGILLALFTLILLVLLLPVFPLLIVYWVWGLIEAIKDAKSVLTIRSLRERTISFTEFESELVKLHQLVQERIISVGEFTDKKLELLSRLENSITSENKNEILLSCLRLHKQNLLSEIDYQQIRNYNPLT